MTPLEQKMRDAEFVVIDTGGGCTAYSRTAPIEIRDKKGNLLYENTIQILITDIGGGSIPTRETDEVLIGVYDADGDEIFVREYSDITSIPNSVFLNDLLGVEVKIK